MTRRDSNQSTLAAEGAGDQARHDHHQARNDLHQARHDHHQHQVIKNNWRENRDGKNNGKKEQVVGITNTFFSGRTTKRGGVR